MALLTLHEDVLLELAEKVVGVDFNQRHFSGYMGPGNEQGLFLEQAADYFTESPVFDPDNEERAYAVLSERQLLVFLTEYAREIRDIQRGVYGELDAEEQERSRAMGDWSDTPIQDVKKGMVVAVGGTAKVVLSNDVATESQPFVHELRVSADTPHAKPRTIPVLPCYSVSTLPSVNDLTVGAYANRCQPVRDKQGNLCKAIKYIVVSCGDEVGYESTTTNKPFILWNLPNYAALEVPEHFSELPLYRVAPAEEGDLYLSQKVFTLHIGDWVIIKDDGGVSFVDSDTFEKAFTVVNQVQPQAATDGGDTYAITNRVGKV